MNIPELFALATLIKNETGIDKNTATRIGILFDEIIKKITEGGGGEGSGIQVITIANLSELDALPQGVYLIKGVSEGLLVVVESQSDYTISIEYQNYIASVYDNNVLRAKSILVYLKYLNEIVTGYNWGICFQDDEDGGIMTDIEASQLTDYEYNLKLQVTIQNLTQTINSNYPEWSGIEIPTEDAIIIQ